MLDTGFLDSEICCTVIAFQSERDLIFVCTCVCVCTSSLTRGHHLRVAMNCVCGVQQRKVKKDLRSRSQGNESRRNEMFTVALNLGYRCRKEKKATGITGCGGEVLVCVVCVSAVYAAAGALLTANLLGPSAMLQPFFHH